MGVLAWFLGVIGGACTVMGIITAVEVVPVLALELTWMFWFGLAGVLLIASIAALIARGAQE